MLNFIKKNWAILLALAVTYWALKALLVPGFFPIHDDQQIARIFELDKALREGQIPVRWISDFGFGFGYPLFNFYPPLSYYFAEVFHLIGFSFIDSAKLVFISGFLLSSLFMYLWVKDHFGKLPALFSAVLYVYAPYHAVEVYVRGSLPDFTSYALLPGIFWVTDKLFKYKKLNIAIILGLFAATIPLSHVLKAVSLPPFFLIYLIFLLIKNKREIRKLIILLSISLLVSLGLTAFFWMPSILEKNYTLVDKINIGELYNYKLHFAYLRQFLSSPWGYGGSIFGLEDGISFEIGKIHLLFSFFAALILVHAFLVKKIAKYKIGILSLGLFLTSLYFSSFHSEWIWNRIEVFSYIQFPWRFLAFSALFSSFTAGFVIYYIQQNFGKKLSIIFLFIFSAAAVISVLPYFQPQKYLTVTDSRYTNLDDIRWRVSKSSFEFVPSGVATKLSDIKTTQVDLERQDVPKSPYKIIKGSAEVEVLVDESNYKKFQVYSRTDSEIQLNTFSFPGWKVNLNGKEIKYKDNNKLKLITIEIPKGKYVLTLRFENTKPRAIGNAISLVTALNLIGFGLFKLWRK